MKLLSHLGVTAAIVAGVSLAAFHANAGIYDIGKQDNGCLLGVGASTINYREIGVGSSPSRSVLDDETGWLPTLGASCGLAYGVSGAIPYLCLDLEGATSLGNTRYSGATLGGTPITATTKDQIYSANVRIGRVIPLSGNTVLTPFIEAGYRYWHRNLGPSTGVEDYENGELMGGLLAQFSPLPKWVLSLSGAAGSTYAPQMKSSGGASPATYELGSEGIWRLRAMIGYRLTKRLELTGMVEFLRFGYGASAVNQAGFYEPQSTTEQTTLLSGLTWQFF